MTGLYVRIKRDGKWQNLELDQLSDQEMDAFICTKITTASPHEAWRWVKTLAQWIRDNVGEQNA